MKSLCKTHFPKVGEGLSVGLRLSLDAFIFLLQLNSDDFQKKINLTLLQKDSIFPLALSVDRIWSFPLSLELKRFDIVSRPLLLALLPSELVVV